MNGPSHVFSRRKALQGFSAAALSLVAAPAPAATSRTMLVTHPAFAAHDPGPLIVERPARSRAIAEALSQPKFDGLVRQEAPLRVDVEEAVLRAHTPTHFDALRTIAQDIAHLPHAIDGDTVLSSGSWAAALRAIDAGLHAVDTVLEPANNIKNAFCAVRPPGHHAEAARAMGFCFFSNVAIAALYARARHGIERVAVIDFDVHHGNGTQSIFWSDRNLFYGSTHEMPLFPGTGAVTETGLGNIFNAPLKAGDGGARFRAAMSERILPGLDAHQPDLIVISAGFDAHEKDPLGHIRLQEIDFAWATKRIMEVAERRCSGRIVSMLEGGYELNALGNSVAAHVQTLMDA